MATNSKKDYLIAFLISIFTLPLLFFYYGQSFFSAQRSYENVHFTNVEGREFDLPGVIHPEPIILDLGEVSSRPMVELLRLRLRAISENKLEELLKLAVTSDEHSFSKYWQDTKHEKYRERVAKNLGKVTYYGFIIYGNKKIALSCLQGESFVADTTPVMKEVTGPKLSFISPFDLTLRSINSALALGKVTLVRDGTLVSLPACS